MYACNSKMFKNTLLPPDGVVEYKGIKIIKIKDSFIRILTLDEFDLFYCVWYKFLLYSEKTLGLQNCAFRKMLH